MRTSERYGISSALCHPVSSKFIAVGVKTGVKIGFLSESLCKNPVTMRFYRRRIIGRAHPW